MKTNLGKYACAIFLLGAVATATAQSTWNYFISDAGNGNSLVTWNVTGSLANSPGAIWMLNSAFVSVPISAPDLYADSYVTDGTSQSIPTPDGSYFFNATVDLDSPISGYYTYNVAGSGNDGFGLLFSVAATHSVQDVLYNPGTQSALIPVDYSDFNPGTYQSQVTGFNSALTVNLTVGPVPEPSTLALSAVSGLGGLLALRRRK
jgi:hypothetical protein